MVSMLGLRKTKKYCNKTLIDNVNDENRIRALCTAVCCYVLLGVAMSCHVLLHCCYALLCVAMCCCTLLCIAAICYVLLFMFERSIA